MLSDRFLISDTQDSDVVEFFEERKGAVVPRELRKNTVMDRAQKGDSKSGHRKVSRRNDHQNSGADRRLWQPHRLPADADRRMTCSKHVNCWRRGKLKPLFHPSPTGRSDDELFDALVDAHKEHDAVGVLVESGGEARLWMHTRNMMLEC